MISRATLFMRTQNRSWSWYPITTQFAQRNTLYSAKHIASAESKEGLERPFLYSLAFRFPFFFFGIDAFYTFFIFGCSPSYLLISSNKFGGRRGEGVSLL